MPTADRIVEYWQRLGAPFDVGVESPQCFSCGRTTNDWRAFDRAHLVDRFLGGLDHEANLVMLCPRPCHSLMPMFEIDEWEKAIQWVRHQGWVGDLTEGLLALDDGLVDDHVLTWRIAGWLLSSELTALRVRSAYPRRDPPQEPFAFLRTVKSKRDGKPLVEPT